MRGGRCDEHKELVREALAVLVASTIFDGTKFPDGAASTAAEISAEF